MITININKIKTFIKFNSSNPIDDIINAYHSYIDCNSFSDLRCPLCKHTNCLTYHKSYERNITFLQNNEVIDTKISIAVCICNNCKNLNNRQKYHAILPTFIFPYHTYEASMIVFAIYKYIEKEKKLNEILERLNISHKLFYDWMNKIKKYLLSSSIILKTINEVNYVIKLIYNSNNDFLACFYNEYNHPYFLFKLTCVPLCITP